MAYIKYFWGFDSSIEGWTGNNVQWEDGGLGGLPTPHLYGRVSKSTGGYTNTVVTITLKSPRNLNINLGDILCFIFTWDGEIYRLSSKSLLNVVIEVVDETETVVWSKTLGIKSSPANTPTVCIVKLGANGVGINIKFSIFIKSLYTNQTAIGHSRIDSVTIYAQPDQIIHSPLPSTLQAIVTHDIPLNRSGAFVMGAMRLDAVQNLATYDEKIIYDGATEYDYDDRVNVTVTTTSSVDKVTIVHNADATLQVFYECEHIVWLLDSSIWYPRWLTLIRCYHNQNINNPDKLTFSAVLDGTAPYSATQSMGLKFVAGGLFNVRITPQAEIIGDTTGITSLTATIVVKDAANNVIGTCNFDILGGTYDTPIDIPKTYDNQDLTVEVTVNADGAVSETVTVKLKLNYEFYA